MTNFCTLIDCNTMLGIQKPVLRPNACVHSLVHNPDPLLGGAWWMMVSGGWNDVSTQQFVGYDHKKTNTWQHSKCVCFFVVEFFWMFQVIGPCFTHIPEQMVVGPSDVFDVFFELKTNNWIMVIYISLGIFLFGSFNLRAAEPYLYLSHRHLHDAMIFWTYMCETNVWWHMFFFIYIQNIRIMSWHLDF